MDLWSRTEDIPAKGVWYAHNPRYNDDYGQSQLLGSWRPWRRLAWKDAAETVIDGGFYRFAYSGPVIGYPDETYQSAPGSPNTTLDSLGLLTLCSRHGPHDGGTGEVRCLHRVAHDHVSSRARRGTKMDVKMAGSHVQRFLADRIHQYLQDQIRYGIGVPNCSRRPRRAAAIAAGPSRSKGSCCNSSGWRMRC